MRLAEGTTRCGKRSRGSISAHETEDHFIDAPAYVAAADVLGDRQELKPGQNLNHYQIRSVLGEGGMGKVYLAEDLKLKRKVALKLLPSPTLVTQKGAVVYCVKPRPRPRSTTRTSAPFMKSMKPGTDSYIAMQYVEGETLRSAHGERKAFA